MERFHLCCFARKKFQRHKFHGWLKLNWGWNVGMQMLLLLLGQDPAQPVHLPEEGVDPIYPLALHLD